MNHRTLDPRLSLAFDLYDSCELAADIGTDHAHLPAALLQRGRCRHMVLTDISQSALENARIEMTRLSLTDRVSLRLGNGLTPLSEPCGMISVMGMGGRTIRDILLSGREKLHGASLLLSAHTDWHLIRSAVMDIGYHLDREEPCIAAGRFYLILLARPGTASLTEREIRLGGPLFRSVSPVLVPFLQRRRDVLQDHLHGLESAAGLYESDISLLREDLAYYDAFLSSRIKGRSLADKEGGSSHECPDNL